MPLKKYFVIFILSVCFVPAALASITQYRFYANQVYDVQRSPAFPLANQPFTLTYFHDPYRANVTPYKLNNGEYIQFFFVNGICKDGLVGINLYNNRGDLLETVQTKGHIYGLTREGFLHDNDSNIGTFISTHSLPSSIENLTYLTPKGSEPENCAALENY